MQYAVPLANDFISQIPVIYPCLSVMSQIVRERTNVHQAY